jgi:hypothetical protein
MRRRLRLRHSFRPLPAPVIVATTPADDATEAPVSANLAATFSEPVIAGTGTIELWQVGGVSPVMSFDVAPLPRSSPSPGRP